MLKQTTMQEIPHHDSLYRLASQKQLNLKSWYCDASGGTPILPFNGGAAPCMAVASSIIHQRPHTLRMHGTTTDDCVRMCVGARNSSEESSKSHTVTRNRQWRDSDTLYWQRLHCGQHPAITCHTCHISSHTATFPAAPALRNVSRGSPTPAGCILAPDRLDADVA